MKRHVFIFLVALAIFTISGLMYFLKPPVSSELPRGEQNESLEPIIIILSPHFDDAVFSLGGLLAKKEHEQLVATFFTAKPKDALNTPWDNRSGFRNSTEAVEARTEENKKALSLYGAEIQNYDYLDFQYRKNGRDSEIQDSIARGIQALLLTYQDRRILIYGPAIFTQKITHPDHKLLHEAFVAVAKERKNEGKTQFFVYEDFPYIRQFTQSGIGDFGGYIRNADGVEFEEVKISLTEQELSRKVAGIFEYVSQVAAFRSFGGSDITVLAENFAKARCKKETTSPFACEVVYRLR